MQVRNHRLFNLVTVLLSKTLLVLNFFFFKKHILGLGFVTIVEPQPNASQIRDDVQSMIIFIFFVI